PGGDNQPCSLAYTRTRSAIARPRRRAGASTSGENRSLGLPVDATIPAISALRAAPTLGGTAGSRLADGSTSKVSTWRLLPDENGYPVPTAPTSPRPAPKPKLFLFLAVTGSPGRRPPDTTRAL